MVNLAWTQRQQGEPNTRYLAARKMQGYQCKTQYTICNKLRTKLKVQVRHIDAYFKPLTGAGEKCILDFLNEEQQYAITI